MNRPVLGPWAGAWVCGNLGTDFASKQTHEGKDHENFATLTAVALIWGSATFASGYADRISQAFEQAGYSDVEVTRSGGQWLVSALMNGQKMQFVVDPRTGRSRL